MDAGPSPGMTVWVALIRQLPQIFDAIRAAAQPYDGRGFMGVHGGHNAAFFSGHYVPKGLMFRFFQEDGNQRRAIDNDHVS